MTQRHPFIPILLLCLLLCWPIAAAARSPFQPPPPQQQQEERKTDPAFAIGDLLPERVRAIGQRAMATIIVWQAHIRQQAGAYARHIKENPWGAAFWSYLLLAFAYGVIHALGPGHGKVFVSTYFLSRQARAMQGILMGILMGGLHVLSATVLVLIFYLVLKSGGLGSVEAASRHMQTISAGLICLVGLVLALKAARAICRGGTPAGTHQHGQPPAADTRSLVSLSLAVGLVPCPGAAIILFFSITLDILPAGLLAMLFLAAGLALTTSGFALAALLVRRLFGRATPRAGRSNSRLQHLPAMLGALFIFVLGAVLLFNPVL
ncbi:MAG: hypothetical protein KFF50_12475 [Desulfatitalea sp.]|nr:hypothetical protein [Desulfatitalea sp.]